MKKMNIIKLILYVEGQNFKNGEEVRYLPILTGIIILIFFSELPSAVRIGVGIATLLLLIPTPTGYLMGKEEYEENLAHKYENLFYQYESLQERGFTLKEKEYYKTNLQYYHTELRNLQKLLEQKQEKKSQKKLKRKFTKEQRSYDKL